MNMKTESEITLPYENLPTGNNEMMNSLKILQDTVKYYGKLVSELQITVERLELEIKKSSSVKIHLLMKK